MTSCKFCCSLITLIVIFHLQNKISRVARDSDLEIVQEILTKFQLLVDSAEQPINRPSQPEEQKKYYSGNKKQHTRKNQFVGLPEAQDIVNVEVGNPSPTADINLFRKSTRKISHQTRIWRRQGISWR
ncbi:transposase family protein [Nostoc sp. BAE]|nr:transposase family protein [Nostoc commune BAE]